MHSTITAYVRSIREKQPVHVRVRCTEKGMQQVLCKWNLFELLTVGEKETSSLDLNLRDWLVNY